VLAFVPLLAALAACDPEAPPLAGITAAHERVRSAASPSPEPPLPHLCYSAAVAAAADAWAARCRFAHDPALAGRDQGQNLHARTGDGTGIAARDAVAGWAEEAAHYDAAANRCRREPCGHYTQIVWRKTTRLGCALRVCTTGSPFAGARTWTLLVCNYAPAGNVVGQRPY
jgi:hypothetical protein